MKKPNINNLILKVLFLILGILTISCGIDILVNFDDSVQRGFIKIQYDNIFIKYAPFFYLVLTGLGFVVFAILAQIKVYPFEREYQKGEKVEITRQVFILSLLGLPTIIFLPLMVYVAL